MKLPRNSAKQLVKTMLVFGFMSAMGVTPLFAQTTPVSGTLANLANGGTLTFGDKIFSGFSYQPSDLTSFDPTAITVTASESGGIDYLTWSGTISFTSSSVAVADLVLNYIVTSTGQPIDMIDQSYAGSAANGMLAIDETAAIGSFGGQVVGYSHLDLTALNEPPVEINISPSPQSVLYVTKDISLAVIPPSGGSGYITIAQVEQSFHQVPEPTTTGCFLLGLGALVCCQRFIQKRRS